MSVWEMLGIFALGVLSPLYAAVIASAAGYGAARGWFAGREAWEREFAGKVLGEARRKAEAAGL